MENVLTYKIHDFVGFDDKQKEYTREALNLAIKVLKTQNFKLLFLAMDPEQSRGKTQIEVYNELFSGKSNYTKFVDHILDFHLSLYYKKSSTIARTKMRSAKILINEYHLKKWMKRKDGLAEYAKTLIHEYMHSMGYIHKHFWPFYKKEDSLTYETGYLVKHLVLRILSGEKLTLLQGE